MTSLNPDSTRRVEECFTGSIQDMALQSFFYFKALESFAFRVHMQRNPWHLTLLRELYCFSLVDCTPHKTLFPYSKLTHPTLIFRTNLKKPLPMFSSTFFTYSHVLLRLVCRLGLSNDVFSNSSLSPSRIAPFRLQYQNNAPRRLVKDKRWDVINFEANFFPSGGMGKKTPTDHMDA
ncbi:hypothetical protein CEXT_225941 [Caerostris extrusa]|uniref:Uncharacterized protein n=1 Tax=Caerostris extrusa TaxID=172846 RepID=A0AAV4XWU3_CAEEX|nr:hypothetical protein CEXT_225941 [Caerostris extrusa]